MLIDVRTLDVGMTITADVVIVGAGAAGLTLARELADRGLFVCLLESGGEGRAEEVDALMRGRASIIDHDGTEHRCDEYLQESRARGLGGTLNAWGGKCGELDIIDFESRDWIPHSGWPFDKSTLQPFYDRACRRFRIPTLSQRKAPLDAAGLTLAPNEGRNFMTALRVFSGVTGTGPGEGLHRFKYDVADDSDIAVYLHATVVGIDADDRGHVSAVRVQRFDGTQVRVCGDQFVLAAGGLENARLLLHAAPTLDPNQLVGRYFSGHGVLRQISGVGRPPCALRWSSGSRPAVELYLHKDPAHPQAIWVASKGLQRRERIGNAAVVLEPEIYEASHTPLHFAIEQAPNPDSRLTLDDELDALGCRRLRLEWRFVRQDLHTLQTIVETFARDVEKSGWGRVENLPDSPQLASVIEAARHHMGTTRMHVDPSCGVVDADCRVHAATNLYVAGASVFPTSGIANPTLTLVALAIRLADLLAERVARRRGRSDSTRVSMA